MQKLSRFQQHRQANRAAVRRGEYRSLSLIPDRLECNKYISALADAQARSDFAAMVALASDRLEQSADLFVSGLRIELDGILDEASPEFRDSWLRRDAVLII